MSNCCSNSSNPNKDDQVEIDQTKAVDARYRAAAHAKEPCLCSPIEFDTKLLKAIPDEVIDKDYGCGDPTKWVRLNDDILDLGSGTGKNAFICAQIVGKNGSVIGVDRNTTMLEIANNASELVAQNIGYKNFSFKKGSIEDTNAIQEDGKPLIPDSSVDVVLSNCVLNLVNYSSRKILLENIKRVLKPKGRVTISDIISNFEVPLSLRNNPDLWSGCIRGAWQEDLFLRDFKNLGFKEVKFAEYSKNPWKTIDGIEFRSVTLTGILCD